LRAAICTRYGEPDVVKIQDVPTPAPRAHEVLVRVRATTVASGDHRMRAFDMPKGFRTFGRLGIGFRGPRQPILGTDLAGDVTAVGAQVTRFKPGDAVIAGTSATHAEYVVVREDKGIAPKPANLSYEEAASMLFGGITAICFLEELAHVGPGQRVAINGASGAVGAAAVQLAKHLGAIVTGVASGANTGLVKALGADEVVDYTKESFLAKGRSYDVIFDTVGKTTYKQCKGALTKQGVYLPAVGTVGQLLRSAVLPRGRVRTGIALANRARVLRLCQLIDAGALKPVIDRTFPFEEIVGAHKLVDTGHKRGSVVVRFAKAADGQRRPARSKASVVRP
jgi:NADPH:quinone reductase-like Zn-dependent oxidoreductase